MFDRERESVSALSERSDGGFVRACPKVRVIALALAHLLLAACAARPASESPDPSDSPPPPRRPNVLFIAVDDLRPELGCYGAHWAESPHLDAFAREAALFENHFVQAPSCGPSRYALLTGRSPARSGALGNSALYRGPTRLRPGPSKGARSLPELFRRGGYRTVCIGKISHTPDGRVYAYDGTGDGRPELPGAWDELATPFGPWERGWGSFFAYPGGAHREDGATAAVLSDFSAERDTDLPDGLLAGAAVDALERLAARDEPFFLGVGFYKPHMPFSAPARDRAVFDGARVPVADVREPWPPGFTHASGEFRRYSANYAGELPETDAEHAEVRRAYLACVRYVDRQVGLVLDALEERGLADSTIVVIWGDHGFHLGESGVWGKHTVLERSLASPLLVRAPGVTRAGSRITGLAASIDVFPTLVDLAGLGALETAEPVDGVSLRPLLEGTTGAVRDECTAYYGDMGTVRTAEHRLVARRASGAWVEPFAWAIGPGDPGEPDGPDPTAARSVSDPALVTDLLGRLQRER